MENTMTENQLARIGKDLAGIAGEPCDVQDISGCIYVFTSELGSLRLLQKYRECKNARAGFSKNRNTYYFSLEVNLYDQL